MSANKPQMSPSLAKALRSKSVVTRPKVAFKQQAPLLLGSKKVGDRRQERNPWIRSVVQSAQASPIHNHRETQKILDRLRHTKAPK